VKTIPPFFQTNNSPFYTLFLAKTWSFFMIFLLFSAILICLDPFRRKKTGKKQEKKGTLFCITKNFSLFFVLLGHILPWSFVIFKSLYNQYVIKYWKLGFIFVIYMHIKYKSDHLVRWKTCLSRVPTLSKMWFTFLTHNFQKFFVWG